MESREKFLLSLISVICASFTIIITSSLAYHSYKSKLLIENGYEQKALEGSAVKLWQKK